jgi:hypothetical protein
MFSVDLSTIAQTLFADKTILIGAALLGAAGVFSPRCVFGVVLLLASAKLAGLI